MAGNGLKRVRYEKSPLVEVIFQLRFPTILSINSNQPVDFQERVREKYPFFEEQVEEQGDILYNPQIKATALRKTGENKNYTFRSNAHIVEFFLLGVMLALFGRESGWKPLWGVMAGLGFGLLDEGIRLLLPTREFDIMDLLRDWGSILLAFGIVLAAQRISSERTGRKGKGVL